MSDKTGLELLADAPPPRRTDAAFARAVTDGVKHRRARSVFMVPALAALTAGLAVIVFAHPLSTTGVDAGIVSSAPGAVIAMADLDEEDDAPFALPTLDGSSDEELASLDRALDQAMKKKL